MNTNIFNLLEKDISTLIIKETYDKTKCFIWDKDISTAYIDFILDKNSKTTTICSLNFFRSSKSDLYIPRPTFKKVDNDSNIQTSKSDKIINISFNKSEQANKFWELMNFIGKFKELVDLGDFEKKYIIAKNDYILEFEKKDEKEKFEDIKELIGKSDFKSIDYLKQLEFYERKKNLKAFLYLLKNHPYEDKDSFSKYKEMYKIKVQGQEVVWQHFLLNHLWILGLNADFRIINSLLDEQNLGSVNNKGKESPTVDFLGISNYTILIELKTSNTKIFKKTESKSRANTWDFTSDFIEGISQCLGQKFEFEKEYESKKYIDNEDKIINNNKIRTLDSKVLFIIGNRSMEFPHNEINENIIKSETFERFKRNSKNIEILTFDELFERSYYIVFNKPLPTNWLTSNNFEKDFD